MAKKCTDHDILDALAPFAVLGSAFGEECDPTSTSPRARLSDDAEVQVSAAKQEGRSVTVGELRRAARAYYSARD
jgi:hypothetical protein